MMLIHRLSIAAGVLGVCAGCSDLTNGDRLPAGTRNPDSWHTPAGALAMYHGAVRLFETGLAGQNADKGGAYLDAITISGLLSDELQASNLGGWPLAYRGQDNSEFAVDARQARVDAQGVLFGWETEVNNPYNALHTVRARGALGIVALIQDAPDLSPALRGHLYALIGYAEILLADLYCSGIPLSTLDFKGDFTYQPGSITAQVYGHAVSLFDTALSLSRDSVQVMHLARVGKGRALLALGRYQEAADAVRDVPLEFQRQFAVQWGAGPATSGTDFNGYTVSDREGRNGLPYVSNLDPRTAAFQTGTNEFGMPLFWPTKYGAPGENSHVTIASGIEARLIRAEYDLQTGRISAWLDTLNLLRRTYAPSLPDIVDPGTPQARQDTLFAERAAWLFLTAHRQGDLRRLIRQYGRTESEVYPIGAYPGGLSEYGSAVALPIPKMERVNPHFTGCLSREI